MKLAALALLTTLGLGGAAYADPGRPDAARPHGQLRQLLLERFDANHDGRLEPQERRHAAHALRRLARKMAMQDRRTGDRAQRARGMARRHDTNGDGVVGPQEMPPGAARRLPPLDQNGDGWLDDRDSQ
ncbi:MAG: hypothetical protein ABIY55_02410 [Kofleriaceae bacterium]